ncbi:MAG: hypothetical protein C0483_06720 [Pirellula sp.]|nr:hypothetical protein [Pirellula sp.]
MSTRAAAWAWATAIVVAGCTEGTPVADPAAATPSVLKSDAEKSAEADLASLPVPSGATKVFVSGDVAMYATEASVKSTLDECAKRLSDAGWEPYGAAGDSRYFKRGLVRLNANIVSAAAQGGKTMLSYTREKMSVDLPAPSDAEQLQYSNTTTQLHFDSPKTLDELCDFYRRALEKGGWKATTDRPLKSGFRDELIFRSPTKAMLTLSVSDFEGKRRVTLKHETAEQVAAAEKRFQEEKAKREAKENMPLPKLTVELPSAAKDVKTSKGRVEFELPAGEARACVAGWQKFFAAAGWKERVTTLEKVGGLIAFTKDDQTVTASYTDPGFIGAEVSLLTTGVEVEPQVKK